MEGRTRWKIPAFGDWESCDEMPITQYFESARQAGLLRPSMFVEEDLFKVPVAVPENHDSHRGGHCRRKARSGSGVGLEKQHSKEQLHTKPASLSAAAAAAAAGGTPRRRRAPKAVDEDLYKIPPELLYEYQKKKRKTMLRNLFTGCLGLNCVP